MKNARLFSLRHSKKGIRLQAEYDKKAEMSELVKITVHLLLRMKCD